MRHKRSHTNVIATIGPASGNREVIENMINEGIDVCRLNFSHGTHEDHKKVIEIILQLNEELNSSIAILADLQGPKLRIGTIEGGSVLLEEGDIFSLVTRECEGTKENAYISYERLPYDVKPGEEILIDDGKISLKVLKTNLKDTVTTKVIAGGPLLPAKE